MWSDLAESAEQDENGIWKVVRRVVGKSGTLCGGCSGGFG